MAEDGSLGPASGFQDFSATGTSAACADATHYCSHFTDWHFPFTRDPRKVVSDPEARYSGGRGEERSLVPLAEARLGRIGFDEWLRRSQAAA